MDAVELDRHLRSFLRGEHSSLCLTFNAESALNYETVAQYLERPEDQQPDWISAEERLRAAAENSMWVLHWYPDTPVGSYSLAASALEPLLREALLRHHLDGDHQPPTST